MALVNEFYQRTTTAGIGMETPRQASFEEMARDKLTELHKDLAQHKAELSALVAHVIDLDAALFGRRVSEEPGVAKTNDDCAERAGLSHQFLRRIDEARDANCANLELTRIIQGVLHEIVERLLSDETRKQYIGG